MEPIAQIVRGPRTDKITKEAALKQLSSHPDFPKGASIELEEVDGRWIAAIASVKQAGPPFGEEGPEAPEESGPPSPDGPPVPEEGPPSDGPDDDASEDSDSDDKPKKDKGKSEKSELGHIEHLLTTLLTALGISPDGPEESPIPGADGPPGPPEGLEAPGGPAGPGGPEGDVAGDGKVHHVHERSLKPGEAPPGTTPVGAPAFASVSADHPWRDAIGVKRSFPVEEPIGDASLASIKEELDAIADGTGYSVKQLVEARNESGQRTAKALISR